jgi:hypothetical protein
MVNKRLLIIGAVVAVLFGGALFVLTTAGGSEPPVEVMAARQDLAAGTHLGRIPDEALARIPLHGDPALLGSYLTEPAWRKIQSAGGILVQDIYQYEAVPLSAIASEANPRSAEIPRLGHTDPSLVLVTLTNVKVPRGIQAGDYVDLIVAVEGTHQRPVPLVQPLAPAEESFLEEATPAPFTGEEGQASPAPEPTATASPTPTLTPTPTLVPAYPLAKVIVRAAEVAGVQREQALSSTGSSPAPGAITGLEVVIPREAQEFVIMSDAAGTLGVSVLSPMVDAENDHGPTLGAHFEDLLVLFTADRNALQELEPDP